MVVMSLKDFGISTIREFIETSTKTWRLGHNRFDDEEISNLRKQFYLFIFAEERQQMNNNVYFLRRFERNITSTTRTVSEISDSSSDNVETAVSDADDHTNAINSILNNFIDLLANDIPDFMYNSENITFSS